MGELPSAVAYRAQTRSARARALARRPLSMLEVIYAAEAMGIDVFEHPDLAFLAEMALCLEAPLGWECVELSVAKGAPAVDGRFYKNGLLRQHQWQHPQITYLIALARAFVAADGEVAETHTETT